MTRRRSLYAWLALAGCFASTCAPVATALAQENAIPSDSATAPGADPDAASTPELDALEAQVRAKERSVQSLDALVTQYRARIQEQAATALTLQAQLALLDSRAAEQALLVRRAREDADRLALVQQRLEASIKGDEATLAVRRILLADLLVRLEASDDGSPLAALLGEGSLSAPLARREDWRSLEAGLGAATEAVASSKAKAEAEHAQVEGARRAQDEQVRLLAEAQRAVDEERAAKTSLVAETRGREDEFRRVVADLQRQQQSEADAVAGLRDRLHDTIDRSDESLARGDVLLDWPIAVAKGISAHFHDASYPFRNLFEHPGVDLPTPVGTPVRAAAGGYVAWNRTGKQYGNYVMVIHPNGIASVYAHLSAFAAKPDTYVERGEVIGYSGGRPGDQGAGLSTGAHLHFEVRQNGIPVDPEQFLPEL